MEVTRYFGTRARAVAVLVAITTVARVAAAGPITAPAAVVVGRDVDVPLTIGPGVAEVAASAGSVSVTGGRATWHLPDAHRPQRAILAALDGSGALLGWTSAAISAGAVVRVTTAPHASVVVHVGDATSAPVEADASGIAAVPVVVAPGTTAAFAIVTDARGRRTQQKVELGRAPFVRVLALCTPTRATVVAIDETGAPATHPPALTATAGSAGPLTAGAPGVFTAPLTAARDHVEIEVAIHDEPGARCAADEPHAVPLVVHRAPPPPPAAPRIEVFAAAGYVSNLGRIGAPVAQLAADVRIPHHLFAGLALGGYTTSLAMTADTARIETRVTALPVLARAGLRGHLGPVAGWIGGAAGGTVALAHVTSTSTGSRALSTLRPAAEVFAGASVRAGPGALAVEAGYLDCWLREPEIRGRLGGALVTLGYAIAR